MANWGTTDLAPDATELPVQVTHSGSKLLAIVLFVVAVGMAVAAVAIGIGGPGGPNPLVPARLALAAGAALMVVVLLGGNPWKHMVRWDFTPDGVSYWRRGLFGVKKWAEPMDSYDGVLAWQEMRSTGKSTYVVYIVELKHADNKRHTVQLYCSMSKEGHRTKQEHYARLLGVPALVKTADGYEARAPEDLDKSVRERVAEGSLAVTFDPMSGPPGERLSMHVDGRTLVLQVTRGSRVMIAVGAVLALSAVGLLAAGLVIGGEPRRWVLMGVGVLGGVLGLACLLPALVFRQELLISPEEVRRRTRTPWGPTAGKAVPADEIEEVLVRSSTGGSMGSTVQCVTDDMTLQFGGGLPRAAKDWVRDCIIAVVGSSPNPPAAPLP